MEIFIPQFVRTALDRLNECGYEGYIVGGCVRDSLLGKKPHDYDVCTNCTPDKMLEVFANFRTIETGLKHGTLTVLIEGEPVEITCYRSDGEYIGHRKPAQVTFESSLEEDLKRRDFTVNAMAYSPKEGLIDLYGGQGDLEKGIIKCVGEPEKRFDEDALRILRGLRFSSCLGFEIEEKTSKAILEQRELLKSISAERIASELKKLLCGKGARKILLDYREVIAVFIPELRESFDFRQNNPHHFLDVYGHICLSVENVRPQWQMRLTMLLHDIGKDEQYESGISHDVASERVADAILGGMPEDVAFELADAAAIKTAIRGHRRLRVNSQPLERLLYAADKASRACFACPARNACNWSDDKKNLSIRV